MAGSDRGKAPANLIRKSHPSSVTILRQKHSIRTLRAVGSLSETGERDWFSITGIHKPLIMRSWPRNLLTRYIRCRENLFTRHQKTGSETIT